MIDKEVPAAEVSVKEWLKKAGYEESRTVEKLMEHLFLSEVLQECWFRRRQAVEVLRAEVDAAGYDLVLQVDGVLRHVQLKASRQGGKTSSQTVNRKLAKREGGCVVWISYAVDENEGRAKLTYRWWDRKVKTLPDSVGRDPRTRRDRPGTAVLKKSDFDLVESTPELVDRLFPYASPPVGDTAD